MNKFKLDNLNISHLWALTAMVGIFVFVSTHPIRPQDFWWHIAIGREIVNSGRIPSVDIYSYTEQDQPYPSYQMYWLMEIALYKLYQMGGPALVVFFQAMVITSAYFLVLWVCLKRTGSWRIAAFGVLFAAALGINDWNVRPQVISFLLFALFLWAIDRYRTKPHWGWMVIFPIGMIIWVNSHGTFPLGFILLGIWFLDEIWLQVLPVVLKVGNPRWRNLIAPTTAIVLTGIACLLNPRGIGILDYLNTMSGSPIIQNLVPEWAAPTFSTLDGKLFFGGLLLTLVILAIAPRRPSFYQIAIVLVFTILGLRTSRGIVWSGMVIAPILSEFLGSIASQPIFSKTGASQSRGNPVLNRIFVVLLLGMAFIALPWFKHWLPLPESKAGLVSSETPLQATNFLLKEHPEGRIFNAISFGSYLIWAAYPEYQVFVDPRIELYPADIWGDYLMISNAQAGWQERLKNYNVRVLMLSPLEQPGLLRAAGESTQWSEIYLDPASVIFILNNGQ